MVFNSPSSRSLKKLASIISPPNCWQFGVGVRVGDAGEAGALLGAPEGVADRSIPWVGSILIAVEEGACSIGVGRGWQALLRKEINIAMMKEVRRTDALPAS